MPNYYVNNRSQPNGDHEVHTDHCRYLPADKQYLGNFGTCYEAVVRAKQIFAQVNGCYACSHACHTSEQ